MNDPKTLLAHRDVTSVVDPVRQAAVRRALELEFRARHRRLWSVAYRMTRTAEDADEVLQETFVRAVVSPPPIIDEALFPWLLRVAVNVARDLLRRRRCMGRCTPAPDGRSGVDDAIAPGGDGSAATPEQRFEHLEGAWRAFHLAIEALTPTAQAVVVLREVFGLSAVETAEALDLSQANVRTTHHRARMILQASSPQRESPVRATPATRRLFADVLEAVHGNEVAVVRALLEDHARARVVARPDLGAAA